MNQTQANPFLQRLGTLVGFGVLCCYVWALWSLWAYPTGQYEARIGGSVGEVHVSQGRVVAARTFPGKLEPVEESRGYGNTYEVWRSGSWQRVELVKELGEP